MRLWSLHPKYLDAKGLVALWREGLLAKHVLEGRTKGYKNHPQLSRFKAVPDPIGSINAYLTEVEREAASRGYHFDKSKLGKPTGRKLSVTSGQIDYEVVHLKNKLTVRDPKRLGELITPIAVHPMFVIKEGDVEDWEIRS